MRPIIKTAFFHALALALYIALVAFSIFFIGSTRVGQHEATALVPIFMLMLFVFSAALTSSLMFGRPLLWYLDGKKKEALQLFGYTLGIFFIITILGLGLIIALFSR